MNPINGRDSLSHHLQTSSDELLLRRLLGDLDHEPDRFSIGRGELGHIDFDKMTTIDPEEAKDGANIEEESLQELDSIKEVFGASAHVPRPEIDTRTKFLGFPIDSVRAWISKAIVHHWFPPFFWLFLGEKFGVSETGISKYEYISLTIQAIGRMKEFKTEISERLMHNHDATAFFQKKTGLTFHASLNNPAVLVQSLEDYILTFETQYAQAKKENRLEAFFSQAFDSGNICFEARVRHLQEYASTKNKGSVDLELILNYSKDSTIEEVLMEELRVYRVKLTRDGADPSTLAITGDQFKQYLKDERHISDLEARPTIDQDSKNITEANLNETLRNFIDVLCILDEPLT